MARPNERIPARDPYPLTVGRLARHVGLSRSTLLYYDRIGLLRPSLQSTAGYRLYAATDGQRLDRIVELRAAGLALSRIQAVLDGSSPLALALAERIADIDGQLSALQAQREVLRALLGSAEVATVGRLDKAGWTALFRAIGLDDAAMLRWHGEFERSAPGAHAAFLCSLGLSAAEVAAIRRRSRLGRAATGGP